MAEKIEIGNMLPLFTLPTIQNGEISISNYKGSENLVICFFDADCPQCLEFLDKLANAYTDFRELNTEILAIGNKQIDELAREFSKKKIPFPIMADEEGGVWKLYSAGVLTVIASDKFGEIRLRMDTEGQSSPDISMLTDAVSLMELECPECGIATWRV